MFVPPVSLMNNASHTNSMLCGRRRGLSKVDCYSIGKRMSIISLVSLLVNQEVIMMLIVSIVGIGKVS